ncbi:MAG TPA: lysophospholipid acyltransferase family protein [Steroidobacteraceae bacterium]|nr:lysophospholipid acyltransferase family protein [Steroidobacteraceae bacterium]
MQWLASLVFTIFLFAWTGAYAVMFVIVGPLMPFRMRFVMARAWGGALLAVLRLVCRLDYRVEGAENLPRGNHIALIKHSSAWETFAQVALVPPHVWVLKRELVWVPFLGWALKLMRAIAIDRGAGHNAVQSVLQQGRQRLAEGEWIVIFPEGTRMPPGQTRRYGVSGALLARENERLIVPIAHDAGYYWPRRGLYKKRGTIRVVIGPPISAAGREPREVNEEAQAWIEAHSRH